MYSLECDGILKSILGKWGALLSPSPHPVLDLTGNELTPKNHVSNIVGLGTFSLFSSIATTLYRISLILLHSSNVPNGNWWTFDFFHR